MNEPRHVGFLFTGAMVRAVLAGEKSQTRRIIKAPRCALANGRQPLWERSYPNWAASGLEARAGQKDQHLKLCYGGGDHPEPVFTRVYPKAQLGDLIWGRETLREDATTGEWVYAADRKIVKVPPDDQARREAMAEWDHRQTRDVCVSIHMPRFASRLWLEVTEVRAQRVQEITEADALAEGAKPVVNPFCQTEVIGSARHVFQSLWESINGSESWAQNDWVFAYSFRRVDPPAITQ